MIRSELVLRVASRHPGMTRAAVEAAVDALLGRIAEALAEGDRVEIRDFGSFSTRRRAPRTAFNPRSGHLIDVEERTAVAFRPGRWMRTLVMEGGAIGSHPERDPGPPPNLRRGWTSARSDG
ncbi:integration host factor subunit beta [Methylobacterium sp. 092160098-2]|uniref:HU family DNA-binding protein n=1 Tax=Methylobacterium sp. 092160098-2 TaxID=3025129 RepID=UPI002381C4FF|nr:HU family DNA-binding protein [Methylobacterium sp. 092160098-2]MDE4914384.1 integration host factor subunit beta [Methylobacterium sp. 092160098-2]